MIVAQISDTHVAADDDPAALYDGAAGLRQAVGHLNALDPRPDMVLATGDLAADGKPEEYDRLAEILTDLDIPVYLIPGNHDDRELLRARFGDAEYFPDQGFVQFRLDAGPLAIVALDTLVQGEEFGTLCEERLAWLDAALTDAAGRPTIVALHHPPFSTGLLKMDETALRDPARFGRMIESHGDVQAVLCGHLHRPTLRRFFGTVAMSCPSTAFQLSLKLEGEGSLGISDEPPACLLHYWNDNGGLTTHMSLIGPYRDETIFDGNNWVAN